MSTRVSGSLLLLIALVFAFTAGDFAAQDPQQPAPAAQPAQQPDLSGTYTGTFNCDAAGLTGDTTLTITGNQFTTADGKTGRIVTSKSGGYTAVALQVGEATGTTAPQIVSMRARKSGSRLIMTAAPGTMMKCSFTPATAARGRRGQKTPAPTGTEVAAPATAPVPATSPTTPPTPPTEPMPAQTPSPSPTASPTPQPEPSPEPNPSPMPSPSPQPNPSPEPNPSPMPSPTASPTPSPTPSPMPRG